jgi:carnitine O-acetyltransferase
VNVLILDKQVFIMPPRFFLSRSMSSWKHTAPCPLPRSKTFVAQQSLQKLPVPDLDTTLAKLKDSLSPLAWHDREWNHTLSKIDEFANGPGRILQDRLVARSQERDRPHWLEQWWDDAAYLGYRDSVRYLLSPTIHCLCGPRS